MVNAILESNDGNKITPENISDPKVQKDLLGRLDKLAHNEKQSPEVARAYPGTRRWCS